MVHIETVEGHFVGLQDLFVVVSATVHVVEDAADGLVVRSSLVIVIFVVRGVSCYYSSIEMPGPSVVCSFWRIYQTLCNKTYVLVREVHLTKQPRKATLNALYRAEEV